MWDQGSGMRPGWRPANADIEVDLFGAVETEAGPHAVGDDGKLIADHGDGWEVVFDEGPATRKRQLRAADVTDDGERIWMVGSSGVIAAYDVDERRKYDYSYPNEMTSTWDAVAVVGDQGGEKVLAANGSGEVLPFVVDGHSVEWGQLEKPVAQGSHVAGLAATPDGVGFAVDTAGNAYKTTPDAGWKDVGVVNAQVAFHDVYAGDDEAVYIAADDGHVYRYDDTYHDWTPIQVDEGVTLRAVDVYDYDEHGKQMVVLGDGGHIYHRIGAETWEAVDAPTEKTLLGLALGYPDVAVGDTGTILVRPRRADDTADEEADESDAETELGLLEAAGAGGVVAMLAEQADVDADELVRTVNENVDAVEENVSSLEEALTELAAQAGDDLGLVREIIESVAGDDEEQ